MTPKKPPPAPAKTYAQLMAEQVAATAPKTTAPKKLQLPIWPDAVRCVPNAVLRSALFGISANRKFCKTREIIATVDGAEIRFKGERFNQTDLDLWETLIHLTRTHPLGAEVEFTAYAILKKLGRGTSGQHHEELKEQFARLGAGWVEITLDKQRTFAGTLISGLLRDEISNHYLIKFNPDLLALYESGYTLIDWSERAALGANGLAKWLHGHYATHAKPYAYKVDTLKELSGSDVAELKKFRQTLKRALGLLVDVGFLVSFAIGVGDLVHVVRPPKAKKLKGLR